MSFTALAIIILCLAMIVSGIIVLKKSAKKFNLSEEQLLKIKERNRKIEREEQQENQD